MGHHSYRRALTGASFGGLPRRIQRGGEADQDGGKRNQEHVQGLHVDRNARQEIHGLIERKIVFDEVEKGVPQGDADRRTGEADNHRRST